jgi:2-oxoglutarate dehydrogenase complex dehydrogenase (E1) component-like enzyme
VASSLGVEGIEMGMAHRGRMNILHNFFQKPLKGIINMFSESEPSELGDVKYHLGTRAEVNVVRTDNVLTYVYIYNHIFIYIYTYILYMFIYTSVSIYIYM